MTDALSPDAAAMKLEAAQKGRLFQTLTARFSAKDLNGGFDGMRSEDVFYTGLPEQIMEVYKSLGCDTDYAQHLGIDPMNEMAVPVAIRKRIAGMWEIMRYLTPEEMRKEFRQVKPMYDELIAQGPDSACPFTGQDKRAMPGIEMLVTVYHMSMRAGEMVGKMVPGFMME